MKKIYFFLCAFLMTLTGIGSASAQEVYLYNVGKAAWLQIGGTEVGSTYTVTANYTDENTKFEFVENGTEGQFFIKNVATGLCMDSITISASVKGVDEADAVAYIRESLGNGIEAIRPAHYAEISYGGYSYLHCSGSNVIVGWETSSTSTLWYVIPAENVEAAVANIAKTGDLNAAIASAKNFYTRTQVSDRALITSVDQLGTNAQETIEGPIKGLIDGITSVDGTGDQWYFHSSWSNPGMADVHNFYVKLPENELKTMLAKYATRNANNRPTEIKLYGGQLNGEEITWEEEPITTLTTADGLGEAAGSFTINTGETAYTALRFDVTATNTSTKFFTLGEFNLYEEGAVPAEFECEESLVSALTAAIADAEAANPVSGDYSQLIQALTEAEDAIRATVTVERTDLEAACDAADDLLYTADAGMPGHMSKEAYDAIQEALDAAMEVVFDDESTEADCKAAHDALDAAIAAATPVVSYPTDAYFTITNQRGSIVYDPAHSTSVDATNDNSEYIWYSTAVNAEDPNHLWGFYKNADNDEIYLYNVGKRLFASSAGQGSYGATWIFSKTPCPIKMEMISGNSLRIMGGELTMSISTSYTGPVITYYAAGDGGVPFTFASAEMEIDEEVSAAIEELIHPTHVGLAEFEELQTLVETLEATIAEEENFIGNIGYHSTEAYTAFSEAISEAKALVEALAEDAEDYTPAIEALDTLKAARTAYDAAENYVLPEAGKTYTIQAWHGETTFNVVVGEDEEAALALTAEYAGNDYGKWLCAIDEEGKYSFANEKTGKYFAFKSSADEAFAWTLRPESHIVLGHIALYGTYTDGRTLYLVTKNDVTFDQAGGTFNPASTNYSTDFIFEETTAVGIEGVNAAPSLNGAIYDLSGRRIAKAQSGLYIVNGKKVLVK